MYVTDGRSASGPLPRLAALKGYVVAGFDFHHLTPIVKRRNRAINGSYLTGLANAESFSVSDGTQEVLAKGRA
jgi:hypothetical protein